jgi:hypothetical protein
VALLALMTSFGILASLAGALGYYSLSFVSTRIAVGRSAVFVVFMAGVHFIGYRLWKRQVAPNQGGEATLDSRPVSPVYWRAARTALLQQGIVLVLAAMVLDGGLTYIAAIVAVVAYWLAFGIIILRRPCLPTPADVLFMRYGFLLVSLAVVTAAPFACVAFSR